MSRKPTAAMHELWDELSLRGMEESDMPSARTLEDWQSEGLIDTDWRSAGRGKGRVSVYKPGTAEKVFQIVEVLAKRRSFDWARMILFYRGYDVDSEKLRESYVRVLAEFPEPEELQDAALDEAATIESRRHARVGQRHLVNESQLEEVSEANASEVVASAIRNSVQALYRLSDTPLMPEDTNEMAVVHGIPIELWERLLPEEVEDFEDKLDLHWITAQTSEITYEQLIESRDRLRSFLDSIGMTQSLEEVVAPIVPISHMFSVDTQPPDE